MQEPECTLKRSDSDRENEKFRFVFSFCLRKLSLRNSIKLCGNEIIDKVLIMRTVFIAVLMMKENSTRALKASQDPHSEGKLSPSRVIDGWKSFELI